MATSTNQGNPVVTSSGTAASPQRPLTPLASVAAGRARLARGVLSASNASPAGPTCSEPAPTNLTSGSREDGRGTRVYLHWTNTASNDDSCYVESCMGATCTNFSVIATLGANYTSYMVGYHYYYGDDTRRYRVRTHGPCGFSGYSNIRNQVLA